VIPEFETDIKPVGQEIEEEPDFEAMRDADRKMA